MIRGSRKFAWPRWRTGASVISKKATGNCRRRSKRRSPALPGAPVAIVSKSTAGGRIIAQAIDADRGDEFYVFDAATKKLRLVAAN
jgi:hypothetical protein